MFESCYQGARIVGALLKMALTDTFLIVAKI